MAPLTFAPASLGFMIVLVTTAIIAIIALSGFALYKLRTSIAASRPVDVEATTLTQIQVRDTFGRLTRARAGVDSHASSQDMLLIRPESSFIQGPLKTTQHSDIGLIASSSFEAWASSLCDLIEDFTGVERTPKASSSQPCLVPSSSFEVWAANLCDLISDFASPAPFRSGFTPLIDTFEDDPYIFDTTYQPMYETTATDPNITIPDIMVTPPSPRLEENADQQPSEPGLVASPSFVDLAAECVEELYSDDSEAIKDNLITRDATLVSLADEPLDQSAQHTQNESILSLSSLYTTDNQINASGSNNEEQTGGHNLHGQSQSSQYLSPTSAFSLPPVAKENIVEYEPEETLKSVFESDSEDDETYYSRRPHLSRPKRASQSMSSMLRNIVEKRKAQQSHQRESKSDKENSKKHSRTTAGKRRLFSKALPTPSEPRNPIKVPTIRFTPPTPPRRFMNKENEDVGLDLERNEVVERIAFDLVIDDHGRCFF